MRSRKLIGSSEATACVLIGGHMDERVLLGGLAMVLGRLVMTPS